MLKDIFRFFVYSSLFIACCAVLMVFQTWQLLLDQAPSVDLYGFVFFATVCSYNFHWYLTPVTVNPSSRVEWTHRYKNFHVALFVVGGLASFALFLRLIHYWPWLLIGAGLTFLYSAPKLSHPFFTWLKKLAIGKTIFLTAVWTYVTTVLPIVVSGELWRPDITLFILSRFFYIYAICILFDYRDREDDRAEGIRSMITYFNEKGINALFYFSLLLFAVLTIWLLNYGHSITNIVLILLPGILLASIYNYAKRNLSDMFYYFVLDGLMMLSALLMLVLSICLHLIFNK